MAIQILILNGPNLNLLGQREVQIYGKTSLSDIEGMLRRQGRNLGVNLDFYQSNHEGHLIDSLHRASRKCQGVIFNPGGYTHTSVAIRDAIAAINIPVIEVHLSNLHAREEFRSRSLTAGACVGQITGLGPLGYQVALEALCQMLGSERVVETRKSPVEEEKEDRDAKRGRRRGRRGGRGRRRDEADEEAPTTERKTRPPVEDLESKYSKLKGVTVRKGVDVLDEIGEEPEIEKDRTLVSFAEAEPEEGTEKAEAESTLRVEPSREEARRERAAERAKAGQAEAAEGKSTEEEEQRKTVRRRTKIQKRARGEEREAKAEAAPEPAEERPEEAAGEKEAAPKKTTKKRTTRKRTKKAVKKKTTKRTSRKKAEGSEGDESGES